MTSNGPQPSQSGDTSVTGDLPTVREAIVRMEQALTDAGYGHVLPLLGMKVGRCRVCGADTMFCLRGPLERLTEDENCAVGKASLLASRRPWTTRPGVYGLERGESCDCAVMYRSADSDAPGIAQSPMDSSQSRTAGT